MADAPNPELEAARSIRRQDLVDLGNDFTQALKPISTLVEHMKDGNERVDALRGAVRRQTYAIWGVIVLVVVVLARMYSLSVRQEANSLNTAALQKDLAGALVELKAITKVAAKTSESVEAAEERALTHPTVHLVPETDPEKAKTAPMKILIETPREMPREALATKGSSSSHKSAKRKPSMKSATVEIPIPAEAF